jgi:hypothetical protein
VSAQEAVASARTVEQKLEIIARELDLIASRLGRLPKSKMAPATGVKQLAEDRHLESTDVRRVFEHWVKVMGKRSNAKLTPERRRCIQARLKSEYTVDFLCRSVDGCAQSDFHMARGQHSGGTKHNDLTLIFRNDTTTERFHDMAGPDSDETRRAFL